MLATTGRMSYGAQLARAARIDPRGVAFQIGDETRTYAELDDRASRVAGALRDLGVGRGDRVALFLTNQPAFVEAFFAVARLGAVVVPVNFRLVAAELAYILDDSGSRVLIADGTAADTVAAAARAGVTVVLTGEDYDALAGDPVTDVDVPESDPLCILYTSGTTGRPKGAVLTHHALVMQTVARIIAQRMGDAGEVWLSGFQLHHIGGLSSLLVSVMLRGRFISLRPGTTAAEIAGILVRDRVTTCSLTPTHWAEVCRLPDVAGRDFALRRISWGSMASTPGLLERMGEVFGDIDIYNLFGQTETASVTCTLSGPEARANRGSAGRPILNVELRIVDDDMADVGPGQVGEIVYRGPTVMREYWRKPDATAAAFAGGWFHSGDLARRDDDGLIWIVDRKKDMIVSGGENIYCAEVEAVLSEHPEVAEVAVVGVPHERWGETPCAVVVPADPERPPGLDELVAHCATRLASYKKPTAVRIVGELPRNANGKVQKFRLRAETAG